MIHPINSALALTYLSLFTSKFLKFKAFWPLNPFVELSGLSRLYYLPTLQFFNLAFIKMAIVLIVFFVGELVLDAEVAWVVVVE